MDSPTRLIAQWWKLPNGKNENPEAIAASLIDYLDAHGYALISAPDAMRHIFERDAYEDFDALKALVGELRERAAPISPSVWDHIGNYMLKAYWLGSGEPVSKVFAAVEPEHPGLHLVK